MIHSQIIPKNRKFFQERSTRNKKFAYVYFIFFLVGLGLLSTNIKIQDLKLEILGHFAGYGRTIKAEVISNGCDHSNSTTSNYNFYCVQLNYISKKIEE